MFYMKFLYNIITQRKQVAVYVLLVIISLISLIFRFEEIRNNQTYNYEWDSAGVLRYMDVWDRAGFFESSFMPVVTYPGEVNKYIDNQASLERGRKVLSNGEGTLYYVSYPPFGYYAPYLTLHALDLDPNIINLRAFNIFVQFATAFVIFLILCAITKKYFIGVIGYTFYIFIPISMYAHTLYYMSNMLVQFFFALSAYLFYLIITRHKYQQDARERFDGILWLFVLSLALAVYTEWIGIFLCAAIFLYAIFIKKTVYGRLLIISSIAIPVIVVSFTVIHYALASDFLYFITVMTERYLTAYSEGSTSLLDMGHVKILLLRYAEWFVYVFFLMIILVASIVVKFLRTSDDIFKTLLRKEVYAVMFVLLFPVLAHHIVFLDWSAFRVHTFSTLKSVIFFSVAVPLLVYVLWYRQNSTNPVFQRIFITILLCVTLIGMYAFYADKHRVDVGVNATKECELGEFIKSTASSDEVIFLKTEPVTDFFPISAVILGCAQRNAEVYLSEDTIRELMNKTGSKKYILYTIQFNNNIVNLLHYERGKLR